MCAVGNMMYKRFVYCLLFMIITAGCSDSIPVSPPALSTGTPTATAATYLANEQRTGVYTGTTAPKLNALLWSHAVAVSVSSPLIVSDNAVYFTTDGYLHELDIRTGKELWETNAATMTPVVAADTIYYSLDGILYALDSRTKQEKWKFQIGANIEASPLATEDTIYVGSDDGYLYALYSQTGQQRWRLQVGDKVANPPASDGNTVYVVGSHLISPPSSDNLHYSDTLFAIDANLGQQKWGFKSKGSLQGPAIEGGTAYFVESDVVDASDILYALDGPTGKEIWQYAPPLGVVVPLTITSDVIYLGSRTVSVDAIDIKTRETRWQFLAGSYIDATSVVDGTIYVSSGDRNIYVLDAQSGTQKGKFETGSPVAYPPVIANGIAYFADLNYVFAVR